MSNAKNLKELRKAKRIISNFCKINSITAPKTHIADLNCLGQFKFSTPTKIYIDIQKCKRSCKRLNSAYIKDLTITGTLIHEFGHYLHLNFYKNELTKKFKALKEPLIHFFETDMDEDIAESIRLFITNPSLLAEGRPKRFLILSNMFTQSKALHFTQSLFYLPLEHRKFTYLWLSQEA